MEPFEDRLRQALRREEPPPDFTARVLSRTSQQKQTSGLAVWSGLFWNARLKLIAPLVLAVLLVSGAIYQDHQRIKSGEEAKEKLIVAMHFTSVTLQAVRQHVIESAGAEEGVEQ